MAWVCPSCGEVNFSDSMIKCTCGFELDNSVIGVTKVRLCPDCLQHNYADQDHCEKCGFDFRLGRSNPDYGRNRNRNELSYDLPVEFSGSAREYFRIWIVNLCLTLLTAGIFSAWAKVRKKRYFYSHTTLDGTPFQYLGRPVPILKGRVIAAIAFSAYYISSHFFTDMLPYVLVAGGVLAPWVIVSSASFNARYSAFRNMTFRFDGRYFGAVKAIFVWGLIPAVMIAVFSKGLSASTISAVFAGAFAIFAVLFPWWIRRFKGFIIEHTLYGNKRGEFSATGGQFFKVYFSAGLIFIPVAIVAAIVGSAVFSFLKDSQISFFLTSVPGYIGYVLAYAYAKAHGNNLVWDHTRLGGLRFKSTLSARGMAKLYLTNAAGIIASLGLLTPWAIMRTMKYRADNLHVEIDRNISDFHGTDTGAVQAVGAELGDIFDMDLSL